MTNNIDKLYSIFKSNPKITTDSRNSIDGSIFFAIKGKNFDGNKYAKSALEQGCSYAVVDDSGVFEDDRFILVDDVLATLHKLANYHRKQMNIKVIAITGTNGKTTTKELTAAILKKKYNTLYTLGNQNNHIGVPLTLLRLTQESEVAIIEIGANHIGEVAELTKLAEPQFGLITNLGKAHLEGFGSFEGILNAKKELFDYIREHKGRVFINKCSENINKISAGIDNISYGINDNKADVAGHITQNMPFVTLAWSSPRFSVSTHKINTNLIGTYNAENLLAAISIGLFFEVSAEDICDTITSFQPQNYRSQYVKTAKNELIVDAYNANPTSMEAALRNFGSMKFKNKQVILGDMLELGNESLLEHKHIVDLLDELNFNSVYLVGKNFKQVSKVSAVFDNKEKLLTYLSEHPIENSTILIKGSNSIGLTSLMEFL
jgi:UDP-N-acetylmuramoyl-tripeptide--D-alanyl-D-alanine ligase